MYVEGFSPRQRKVKKSQELSQGGLVHDIHHTHFCDQEVQDTTPGGHWKKTQGHCKSNCKSRTVQYK